MRPAGDVDRFSTESAWAKLRLCKPGMAGDSPALSGASKVAWDSALAFGSSRFPHLVNRGWLMALKPPSGNGTKAHSGNGWHGSISHIGLIARQVRQGDRGQSDTGSPLTDANGYRARLQARSIPPRLRRIRAWRRMRVVSPAQEPTQNPPGAEQ